ncbi:MAG: MMPL family transporter [Hydrogenophilales bacterium]|nr:MMPL family transporter [Hydrogenophilales bacterium]
MFINLGRLVCRTPWRVVIGAAMLVFLSALYGMDVMERLTLAPGWDVPGSGSAEAVNRFKEQAGVDETPVIVLYSPKPGSGGHVDSPETRAAIEQSLAAVSANPDVRQVISYYSSGDVRFRSRDGRVTYAIVQLARAEDEGIGAYTRLRKQLQSDRIEVRLGGELPTYVDTRAQLERDLRKAEWISFVALAVLLVWVFGSAVAAVLPLIVGGITMIVSVALLKLATNFMDITVYAANVVSMLGLGLAIDYALFIISRFREEQQAESAMTTESVCRTLITAGRTVAFSGLTVAASLFCLAFLPQRFFQNMGLAGGISVVAAMLTAIVVLPAILALLGNRVNYWALPVLARRAQQQAHGGGWWYHFSHFVMRHPYSVILGTLALLLAMGYPALGMKLGQPDALALPKYAESRVVQETLNAHFSTSDLSPLLIAIRADAEVTAPESVAGIHALTKQIQALPGVTRIAGMASLDDALTLEDYQMLYQNPGQFPVAAEALANHARGKLTRLVVFYSFPPKAPEAQNLVEQIRAIARPSGIEEVHVGGYPAFYLDYLDSLRKWVPVTMLAIVGIIFVLLFLMLGSLMLPLKVVLTSLLSLSATFGVLVLIFQYGYLSEFLGFTPAGALDGTVLVLIFASAFGLSIDYEVFLLSRVKEMCDSTSDSLQAVAAGVQRSGPIITNAALLIGIVLSAFAMGEVVFMKQIGLGLLMAVVVDATIVRMLLVPSTMRLLGRLNWWAPKPLLRIYERFNLSEIESISRDRHD